MHKANNQKNSMAGYGIINDSHVQSATFLTSLNQIPADDPYIQIMSDPSFLHLNDKLTLHDDFYDSAICSFSPLESSANMISGDSSTTIHFVTPSWVRACDIMLQIPVTKRMYVSASAGEETVEAIYPKDRISRGCAMPDWNIFRGVFDNITIIAGDSSVPIGTHEQFETNCMCEELSENSMDDNTVKMLIPWGFPLSNLGRTAAVTSRDKPAGTYYETGNAAFESIPDTWHIGYINSILQTSVTRGGRELPGTFKKNANETWDFHGFQTTELMTLKLGHFNNFFKRDRWLPGGLKFNLRLRGKNLKQIDNNIVGHSTHYHTSGKNLNHIVEYGVVDTFFLCVAGIFENAKVVMPTSRLRSPLEGVLKEKWLLQPFTYAYETKTAFQELCTNKREITIPIAINMNKPTQLCISIVDSKTQNFEITKEGLKTHLNNVSFCGSLSNRYPAANEKLIVMERLTILVNGVALYSIENEDYGNSLGQFCLTANDIIFASKAKQAFKSYWPEQQMINGQWDQSLSGAFSSRMLLTIAPGGHIDTNHLPTDIGVFVASVKIVFSAPLKSNQFIRIVKKDLQQLAISHDKIITANNAPAVLMGQSGGGQGYGILGRAL